MGLDAVEIVMAVEDAFDIRLEDREVEKVRTPGQLIDLVLSKVRLTDSKVCLTQRAFGRIRRLLMSHFSIPRNQIAPAIDLNAVLPKSKRPEFLAIAAAEIGLPTVPKLARPSFIVVTLFWLVAASAAVPWVLLSLNSIQVLFGLSIAIVFIMAILAERLTRQWRSEFPVEVRTVGAFAEWITAHKSDLASATVQAWTRDQVRSRVKRIVIEQLGCEDHYREDALFVEDLGLS
jgi:acyl carrier protein